VYVKGNVFDLSNDAPVEGARVVARDVNDVPVSGIATTNAAGEYQLAVPTPRDSNGTPIENQITLRADAAGFQVFPLPPRQALPMDTSNATGNPLSLDTSSTDIGLIRLPNASALGTITGDVQISTPGGTLVVASIGTGGGVTGIADRDGTYTIFNVPVGTVDVKGYKQDFLIDPETATVTAGAATADVNLTSPGPATATVSGQLNFVNAGSGDVTSVILAVRETFNPTAARGEAPPGLRIGGVRNADTYTITGVPNGNYVVLAAFENDLLVRDPDFSQGGTATLFITVNGQNVTVDAFKITEALAVVSPDNEAEVSGTPTFRFAADSGEDHYELRVFDALGNMVWENTSVAPAAGTISVTYGGPALTPGMLYQFRAVSIANDGAPLAATEDLRGTFIYR